VNKFRVYTKDSGIAGQGVFTKLHLAVNRALGIKAKHNLPDGVVRIEVLWEKRG
jgi:hypothetical protein